MACRGDCVNILPPDEEMEAFNGIDPDQLKQVTQEEREELEQIKAQIQLKQ